MTITHEEALRKLRSGMSPRHIIMTDELPPQSQLDAVGLTKDSPLLEFADKLIWGTYGRPARHPVQYKQLRELDTEHLQNILATQRTIPVIYSRAIMLILQERYAKEVWVVGDREWWNTPTLSLFAKIRRRFWRLVGEPA